MRVPRRKAWHGEPPESPDAARRRLLGVAADIVEQHGLARASLSDVAEAAGVTRQTVYRYFVDADDLFLSAAALASGGFLQRMRAACERFEDPTDQIIECLVFSACELPTDPHLGALAGTPYFSPSTALGLGFVQEELARITGDALSPAQRHALADLMIRLLHGWLSDTPPTPDALRATLQAWLAPGVRQQLGT